MMASSRKAKEFCIDHNEYGEWKVLFESLYRDYGHTYEVHVRRAGDKGGYDSIWLFASTSMYQAEDDEEGFRLDRIMVPFVGTDVALILILRTTGDEVKLYREGRVQSDLIT